MQQLNLEVVIITGLVIAIPVLIIISYWVFQINKETYRDKKERDNK